ncbi:hypothetical protein CHS0354_025339 [Potamilus streckersoni]|uniref:Methyltransferase FkbM domain-containing protein n=1 Tax=Potamilus streckersoni TaxID=2493646 RepID=A0AAE0SP70_9BIVA|nr:hypothetical protein CHS0354_025339 [Potamilus streckersoni]
MEKHDPPKMKISTIPFFIQLQKPIMFPSLSLTRYTKYFCVILFGFFLVELIVLNVFVFYCFWSIKDIIVPFVNARGDSFLDRLASVKTFQSAVEIGKDGIFVKFLQETLERLYIESHSPFISGVHFKKESLDIKKEYVNFEKNFSEKYCREHAVPMISFIGLDISHSGEALYIYKRIEQQHSFPFEKIVVDIGANDGFLSSNSFNFIQWGWSAVLVEPLASQLELARTNLARYIDPYRDKKQFVHFVQAVIGPRDGTEKLVISKDIVSMESHIFNEDETISEESKIIEVTSFTVPTLVQKLQLPKRFGILSIDAEGFGNKILHQWISFGCRPAYIIYENLHERLPVHTTTEFLAEAGYVYLSKRGWNYIYELREGF